MTASKALVGPIIDRGLRILPAYTHPASTQVAIALNGQRLRFIDSSEVIERPGRAPMVTSTSYRASDIA